MSALIGPLSRTSEGASVPSPLKPTLWPPRRFDQTDPPLLVNIAPTSSFPLSLRRAKTFELTPLEATPPVCVPRCSLPLSSMASSSKCLIVNGSCSPISLLAEKRRDGCAPSEGRPIEELGLVIPPESSISINCSKYNLNGKSRNAQIAIFFVATEPETAANGADVATAGPVYLHFELKAKGQIYLICAEGGRVTEVYDDACIEEIKMTIKQNTKMKGRFPLSSGLGGLLLWKFFWNQLAVFPAF